MLPGLSETLTIEDSADFLATGLPEKAEREVEMTTQPVYILAVDDDPHILKTLKAIIQEFDMIALTAENVQEALDALEKFPVDVILTDLIMPDIDGLEFIDIVKNSYPTIPIAVLSAYGVISNTVSALSKGAFNFVTKPFSVEGIKSIIDKGLRLRNLSLNTDVMHDYVTNVTKIEIPGDPVLFSAVNYYFIKECQWRGIENDSFLTNLSICFEEMLTNAYIHGNNEDTEAMITVEATFSKNLLTITVGDEGDGFTYNNYITDIEKQNPLEMQNKGLFILQTMSESVSFNETGNEITITLSY